MIHRLLAFALCPLLLALNGCSTVKKEEAKVAAWYHSTGKANLQATAALVAQQVGELAEQDVFSNATSVIDSVAKQQNVQGFAEAGHTLEAALPNLAISQIPSFIMGLRQIWLGPQDHYTKLAANVGQTVVDTINAESAKLGRPLIPAEETQIIEGAIQGLSTATPQPSGP